MKHPCESSEREEAFAFAWSEENNRHGGGPLIALLMSNYNATTELGFQFEKRCTRRDEAVAATVIQWLGTNVGTCFLERVFRDCPALMRAIDCRTPEQRDLEAYKREIETLIQMRHDALANCAALRNEIDGWRQRVDQATRLMTKASARIEELECELGRLQKLNSELSQFVHPPSVSTAKRKITLKPETK